MATLLFGAVSLNPGIDRGLVTGVKASPTPVAAGAQVSVTVTGNNPCGAAFIDYGDGTAVTYAISALPTSQNHVYAKAGTYSITAKGMGNCDGEAAMRIAVTGPPAPPPQPPPAPPATNAITDVGLAPTPGITRQPVTVTVTGHGNCAFVVRFGDGNQQDVNGALPQRIPHTYEAARIYTVIVAPIPPCTGRFTQRLQVVAAGRPRITGLTIDRTPARAGRVVTIDVEGGGACTYRIDYGDGNREDRSKPLPDRLRHVYNGPGAFVIAVAATGGCDGRDQRTLAVR